METINLLDLEGNVPVFTGAVDYPRFLPVRARVDGSSVHIEIATYPWAPSIIFVIGTVLIIATLIMLHSRFPSKIDATIMNLLITGIGIITLIVLLGFTAFEFLTTKGHVVPITVNLQTHVVNIPSLGLSIPSSEIIELRSVTGVEQGASLSSCDVRSELQLIFRLDHEAKVKCLVIAGTAITIAPFKRILSVWKSTTGMAAHHCTEWQGIRNGWRKGLPWN